MTDVGCGAAAGSPVLVFPRPVFASHHLCPDRWRCPLALALDRDLPDSTGKMLSKPCNLFSGAEFYQ